MQKILTLMAIFFFGILVFVSCKKSDDTATAAILPVNKIKRIIQTNYSSPYIYKDTSDYTYDANDRIMGVAVTDGSAIGSYVYNGTTSYSYTQTGTSPIAPTTYYLNSNQLVDSAYSSNTTGDFQIVKFSYDSNNRLSDKKIFGGNSTGVNLAYHYTYSYDASGNLVTMNYLNPSGVLTAVSSYTYTNIEYYIDYRLIYMSKLYHSLPSSILKTLPGSSSSSLETHDYTFDGSNRVSKDSITYTNASGIYKTVNEFSYY